MFLFICSRCFIFFDYNRKRMPAKKAYPHRSEKELCYHGRCGHPMIHLDEKTNREYIMVRKKGGGRKRLYLTKAGRVPARLREKKSSKRPLSAYHKCLSNELEGTKFESKEEFYKRFVESQIACGANVSEKTKKKYNIK